MADETYGYEQARVRLEEIAAQVKRKDTSLEKSLDLLEEGVRLANLCTEQIDHTQWTAVVAAPVVADASVPSEPEASAEGAEHGGEAEPGAAGEAGAEVAVDGAAEDPEQPAANAPYDQEADL